MGYLKESESLTASIAWSSISSLSPPDNPDPSLEDVERMFYLTRKMKLSSVLDFPFYIFAFKNVSRVFTHQWVRYRIAAHVQQSLRYVKVSTTIKDEPWFIIPPSILSQGAMAISEYVRAQIESGRKYLELLNRGIPPEDARFVLPMAVKTHISSVMNAEELLHVIDQRTCFDSQWEIRKASYALLAGLYSISPLIFKHAGPYCISEGICRGRRKGACYKQAKELITKMFDAGKRLRVMLSKVEAGDYVRVDLTDELGFRVTDDVKREVANTLGFPVELDYKVEVYVKKI